MTTLWEYVEDVAAALIISTFIATIIAAEAVFCLAVAP